MNHKLDEYLKQVEKYLKPLSPVERKDIIDEIQNHIAEIHVREKEDIEQIISRMEAPEHLARAYVGEMVSKQSTFNLKGVFRVLSYYNLSVLPGMIMIPTLAMVSGVFYISAFIVLLGGVLKWSFSMFGIDIPFIIFKIGKLPDLFILPIALLVSACLYVLGKMLWRLLSVYLRKVSANQPKYNK